MRFRFKDAVRRSTFACAFVGTMGAAAGASAQTSQTPEWPQRAVRIIVPFAVGGATDIVARLVGTEISKDLGQPVVVENRPGAAGNLGADVVAKSPADGYTLLMGTVGTQAINQLVSKKLPYDAQKDFRPISMIASVTNLLVVPLSSPAKTVSDLVELGKTKELNYASSGVGTSLHLSGEMFAGSAGLKMTHIPYKGSSQAMTDVIGGQVDMIFDNMPVAYGTAKNGQVRPLATTGARRFPLLPDVPTMTELGFKDFVVEAWFGLLAPAGTPDAVVSKVDAAVRKAVMTPEFENRLIQAGAERNYKDPAAFAQHIGAEFARWRTFIQSARISVD